MVVFRILVSTVQYQHVLFNEASYWVPAMEGLKQIVMEANITGVHLHHGAGPFKLLDPVVFAF